MLTKVCSHFFKLAQSGCSIFSKKTLILWSELSENTFNSVTAPSSILKQLVCQPGSFTTKISQCLFKRDTRAHGTESFEHPWKNSAVRSSSPSLQASSRLWGFPFSAACAHLGTVSPPSHLGPSAQNVTHQLDNFQEKQCTHTHSQQEPNTDLPQH